MRLVGILLWVISAVAPANATDYWCFVNSNGGDNANDGRDLLGLEGGAGLYTLDTATGALTSGSNSFAAYTPAAGPLLDVVNLTNASTSAWYTVLEKVADDELTLATAPVAGTAIVKAAASVTPSDGPWATVEPTRTEDLPCSDVTIWFLPGQSHDIGELRFSNMHPAGMSGGFVGCDWRFRGYGGVATWRSADAEAPIDVSNSTGDASTLGFYDIDFLGHSARTRTIWHNAGGDLILDRVTLRGDPWAAAGATALLELSSTDAANTDNRRVFVSSCAFLGIGARPCIRAKAQALLSITDSQLVTGTGNAITLEALNTIVDVSSSSFSTGLGLPIDSRPTNFANGNVFRLTTSTVTGSGGVRLSRVAGSASNFANVEIIGNTFTSTSLGAANAVIDIGQEAIPGITGLTYTSSTRTLGGTGKFTTSYPTFWPGDRAFVTGGAGATLGEYLIASRTSNDAIVISNVDGRVIASGDLGAVVNIGIIRSEYNNPIRAIVHSNTITHSGSSSSGSAIKIGGNCWADVADNQIATSGGVPIAIEADSRHSVYRYNRVRGRSPLVLAEGGNNLVLNNTFEPTDSTVAMSWIANASTARPSRGNLITNNYLVGPWLSDGTTWNDHFNQWLNFNVYAPVPGIPNGQVVFTYGSPTIGSFGGGTSAGAATITAPTSGVVFTPTARPIATDAVTVEFTWDKAGNDSFWLCLGTTANGCNVHDSGALGDVSSYSASIPSGAFVTLYYTDGDINTNYSYRAFAVSIQSGGVFLLGASASAPTNVDQLRALWSAGYNNSSQLVPLAFTSNDTRSIAETGGGLVSPSTGNFATAANSVARGAGFPAPLDIGAVQSSGGSAAASVTLSGGVHLGGSVTLPGGVHHAGGE